MSAALVARSVRDFCLLCRAVCMAEVSAEALFGFTDGTSVWLLRVSDRGVEGFMEDYRDPLSAATGSVLNPFGSAVAIVQPMVNFTVG